MGNVQKSMLLFPKKMVDMKIIRLLLLPLRNQRGGTKTVFTVANAIFQAGMHAYGAIKGHQGGLGYLGGIWSAITTLANWIGRILDRIDQIADWIIRETVFWLMSKIHEFYTERIKKELEKLLISYEDLERMYSKTRARLLFALEFTLANLLPKTWKDIQAMFAMLRDLAAFTYALVPWVGKEIFEWTNWMQAKLNEINNYIPEKINELIRPVIREIDKIWANFEAFKTKHIDPLVESMDRLGRDLHKVLTPEGVVRREFALESGDEWAKVWIGRLRASIEGIEVSYKPPGVPTGKIAEILEKLSPEDPLMMPEEELKIYKYLEGISGEKEWV